jgi:uncharacterized membrane protein YbhN (UPF0104 family)/dTDP-glucose pyrophosphorylase
VIAFLELSYNFVAARRGVRVLLQALVSLGLLALLVGVALRHNLIGTFQVLQPGAIAAAAGLYGAAVVINSRRWQVLLRHVGVREPLGTLTAYYLVGLFFSLFLPTSAGGDAVRVYKVARRGGRLPQTLVATLQERLLVLGASLFVGLGATLYYLRVLPAEFRVWAVIAQIGAATGIALLLYPVPAFAVARRMFRVPGLARLAERPLAARIAGVIRPVAELPPLTPLRLVTALGMAGAGVLVSIGVFFVIARSLQVPISFLELCLVVPVVWIVRMLPVSLNGIGVGEGAFVFLVGLFSVPQAPALALALTVLGLHITISLAGGMVLVFQIAQAMWAGRQSSAASGPPTPEAAAVPDVQPPCLDRFPERLQADRYPGSATRGRNLMTIADAPLALLAGGLATRLRPITETIPKALVEVAGRPFIDHQLELFRRQGVRHVVLCLGYRGEQVQAHLGDSTALGMGLKYSFDGNRLLGTGGALRRAAPLLGPLFWVTYGDSYMDIDYRAVLAEFLRRDALGLMTVLRNDDRWNRSNVVFRDGRLLRYDKRRRSPDMTYIDYGVALLRREALERIPPDEPYDLADLYSTLVAEGRMVGYEVTERFYEIGSPANLAETDAYLRGRVKQSYGGGGEPLGPPNGGRSEPREHLLS